MLARNQVRRFLYLNHGARSPRTPQLCTRRPSIEVQSRMLRNACDGFLGKICNISKIRDGLMQNEPSFRREFSSSGKNFSGMTSLFPKPTTSQVPQGADSYQKNTESMLKRYLRSVPSPVIFDEVAKRSALDGTGASHWQKMCFYGGISATALVILGGAVAALKGEDGSSRAYEVLRSTWSIVLDSLSEFREKMWILLSDAVEDVTEAGKLAAILVRCLLSVLLTISEGPTIGLSGWLKPGVAALVADLAAHENRRKAVLEAGGGSVVDWLLKTVGIVGSGACLITQAEASRALAHLLSDESTCEGVLSRPHALPYLFQFASSLQGFQDLSKGHEVRVDGEGAAGKSMLVTAIMDLVTSSCDKEEGNVVLPKLPANANTEDIATALQVVKVGGWDGPGGRTSDSARKTVKDGTGSPPERVTQLPETVLGQQYLASSRQGYCSQGFTDTASGRERTSTSIGSAKRSSKYGLWDDLQGRLIAVPLAAWALATWAQASSANRAKIAELDENGDALLAAVLAPEKTVKWYGAMTMRLLLGSKSHYSLVDIGVRWSPALLDVAVQAGRLKDMSLAHCALAALTCCVSRSKPATNLVLKEGLSAMREIANRSDASTHVQGAVAQVLDVLTAGEEQLPADEGKKWAPVLLKWVCNLTSDNLTRSCGSKVLERIVNNLGLGGVPISQAWLAMLLMEVVSDGKVASTKGKQPATLTVEAKERERLQNQVVKSAFAVAAQLARVVAQQAAYKTDVSGEVKVTESAADLPMLDLLGLDVLSSSSAKPPTKEALPKVTATEAAEAVRKAVKALTELTAEDPTWRQRILEAGVLCLLRKLLLDDDYEQWAASEALKTSLQIPIIQHKEGEVTEKKGTAGLDIERAVCPHIRRHAARLLSVLTLQPGASAAIAGDKTWFKWLKDCADGKIASSSDRKTRSYALASLLNVTSAELGMNNPKLQGSSHSGEIRSNSGTDLGNHFWPRFEDAIYIMNTGSEMWKKIIRNFEHQRGDELWRGDQDLQSGADSVGLDRLSQSVANSFMDASELSEKESLENEPLMDVVFIHGLRGGPFKTWRVAKNKASTATPLVEKIDEEAGGKGTCWPQEWLAHDLPQIRLLSVKFKTNLSEWSGATLPLQEVSSMLLDKLLAAGVGERPLVFVTHSMGGLVVKQMLVQARGDGMRGHLVNSTKGIVFYSCPHFGSKLADMPWRIGYVLRPAPSIGELRSGSPRLEELNHSLRQLHKEGHLDVLSFSEGKVTPLVEGYGGWGLRMEVVPIESAYPGFGELVVLSGTDHVNSCKPLDRTDPAYTKTLEFLKNRQASAVKESHKV